MNNVFVKYFEFRIYSYSDKTIHNNEQQNNFCKSVHSSSIKTTYTNNKQLNYVLIRISETSTKQLNDKFITPASASELSW